MRLTPLFALPPIALGIAVAAWMISSAPGPAQIEDGMTAIPVRVMTVATQNIRPTATAWGNLRASDTWVAVSEVQGEVIWRHPDLEPGRLIPADTEVLRIDPTDYQLTLAQAEADQAALAAESAQLTTEAVNTERILALERERLALSQVDLERTRTLAKQGNLPQSRLDEAERAALLARRTVAELENALSLFPSGEARIAAQSAKTQAAIDRARRLLNHTTLTTPFDLRVTEVAAERFQTVSPGQVVIRGDGIASAEVVAHLPVDIVRRLIGNVPEGITLPDMIHEVPATRIDVTLSPMSDPDQIWHARVSRIESALDARARTAPVVVTVNEPYEGADPPHRLPLVPNMQVAMTFAGLAVPDAIVLPEAAIHAGTARVVGSNNGLELRPVIVAFTQNGRVVLKDGLSPGDQVVLDDIAPAIPGIALAPVEASE